MNPLQVIDYACEQAVNSMLITLTAGTRTALTSWMGSKIPSGPLDTQTEMLLEEVASRDPSEYETFLEACAKAAAQGGGLVHTNAVRELCSRDGKLTIIPQRFSAYYTKAALEGHLVKTGEWAVCKGSTSGNDGRPQPVRRWLG